MTELEEKLTKENKDLRRQLNKFYSIHIEDMGPYFGLSVQYYKQLLDNKFIVHHILEQKLEEMYAIR